MYYVPPTEPGSAYSRLDTCAGYFHGLMASRWDEDYLFQKTIRHAHQIASHAGSQPR